MIQIYTDAATDTLSFGLLMAQQDIVNLGNDLKPRMTTQEVINAAMRLATSESRSTSAEGRLGLEESRSVVLASRATIAEQTSAIVAGKITSGLSRAQSDIFHLGSNLTPRVGTLEAIVNANLAPRMSTQEAINAAVRLVTSESRSMSAEGRMNLEESRSTRSARVTECYLSDLVC
jgi:hypothetical protein